MIYFEGLQVWNRFILLKKPTVSLIKYFCDKTNYLKQYQWESVFMLIYKKHLESAQTTTDASSVKKVFGKGCLSNLKITVKEFKV